MANAFWKLISVSKTSECQSTGSTTVKYHTGRPLACLVAWWLKKKKNQLQCRRRRFYPCLESGITLGEGNGHPPQYSCLGNLLDRGAWWAAVHGYAKDLDTI